MKNKLIASLKYRLETEIAPQNPVRFLQELPPEDCIELAISVVYLYTHTGRNNKKATLLTEVISAIGHNIRNKHRLKRDSAVAAKAGAFILYEFELAGILLLVLGKAANGHQTYTVEVADDDKLSSLFGSVELLKTEKLPSLVPYEDWTSTSHPMGVRMVKTADIGVLQELNPTSHPLVFNSLNISQHVGWTINTDIYNIYAWALRNKTEAFADIWEMHNPEAKASKVREAKAIGGIAKRFIGEVFYHMYSYDFRGRRYCSTAYLHEQGTDLSKGLLLRADKKAIGEQGFFWLCISIASNWAGDAGRDDGLKTDKIPLEERVHWLLDNEEVILSYVANPKVNQGWMKAEKPWQFLAACMELKRLRDWQLTEEIKCTLDGVPYNEYGYESSLEAYLDGSNNGSQHLSALTRDEITAPHVNLVPSDLPGDLYKYVADHVWTAIAADYALLTAEEINACENLIATIVDYKMRINAAPPKSDRRNELVQDANLYRQAHVDLLKKASPVFWHRITDGKQRRKLAKRGVMTLPYGSTPYGLGQQVIDDARKHGIEAINGMEHAWGSYLGRQIYDDCRVSLRRPTQLLAKFEAAGKLAEQEGRFLSWHVPITNFPVVQHYTEGTTHGIYIQYGPPQGPRDSRGYYANTYKLNICFIEEAKPSKRKQSQGASPNAIHSLDAAHLTLIVNRAPFPVTTVHDSFGALLGDVANLFVIVRETFVELYKNDPLEKLMNDIGGDLAGVELGSLDISLILDSEYAFA